MSFRHEDHPRELLSPYLDGELEKEARSEVESHLAACSDCRAFLRDFRSMAAAAALEAPPPVPADLRVRIRGALAAAEAPRAAAAGRAIWSHRLGLAAAAGAVLVIGLWALRREPVQPGGPPASRVSPFEDAGPELQKEKEIVPTAPPTGQRKRSNEALRVEQPPAPQAPAPSAKSSTPAAPTDGWAPEPGAVSGKRAAPSPVASTAGSGSSTQGVMSRERGRADLKVADAVAGAQATETGAPRGRSLLVEFPGFSVSVQEDGTISLSAKGYSCAARADGPSIDPDIAALFDLASSSGDTAPVAPGQATGGTPAARLLAPASSAGDTDGAAAGRAIPSQRASQIQSRLRSLLVDRYLPLMEGHCGPAPRTVRSP